MFHLTFTQHKRLFFIIDNVQERHNTETMKLALRRSSERNIDLNFSRYKLPKTEHTIKTWRPVSCDYPGQSELVMALTSLS